MQIAAQAVLVVALKVAQAVQAILDSLARGISNPQERGLGFPLGQVGNFDDPSRRRLAHRKLVVAARAVVAVVEGVTVDTELLNVKVFHC